ncbi:hypothetical protein [Thiocapsa sp.]|uniref:hypothetical protein n=1 Tax=Thiocapsa sp. TaxID=2024551 RepID=UPI0025E488D8|nr:hypothetical protein [Thiocapsa sp.]
MAIRIRHPLAPPTPIADLPAPNCRENDVGDYEMRELRAQLARLKEEIEKQVSFTT